MSQPIEKFKTSDYVPTKEAELSWVFITLPGKPDLNGKPRFVASLRVKSDTDGCKALEEAIRAFWKDNKPSKSSKVKSLGFKKETEKTDELDDNGDQIEKETGYTLFNFWTGTTYQDGNTRDIGIYNAKGNKVSLAGKKIGNGSKGSIAGAMSIYDNGPSAQGVTLFLTAIQLTHFIEYAGDAAFDEEEGFEGVESEFEEAAASSDTEEKPRL